MYKDREKRKKKRRGAEEIKKMNYSISSLGTIAFLLHGAGGSMILIWR